MDRAKRWLWTGWGLSALLGFLGPWRKAILLAKGSGALPIQAAVAVMVAVFFLVRGRPQAFFSALLMNVAGLGVGAATAFLTLGALTHKPLYLALVAKWLVMGALLTFAFVRQMRMAEIVPEEPRLPDLEGLTPEEAQAAIIASMSEVRGEIEAMNRRWKRTMWIGAGLLALAAAIPILTGQTSSPAVRSMVYAIAGLVLLTVGTGVWAARRRKNAR